MIRLTAACTMRIECHRSVLDITPWQFSQRSFDIRAIRACVILANEQQLAAGLPREGGRSPCLDENVIQLGGPEEPKTADYKIRVAELQCPAGRCL